MFLRCANREFSDEPLYSMPPSSDRTLKLISLGWDACPISLSKRTKFG